MTIRIEIIMNAACTRKLTATSAKKKQQLADSVYTLKSHAKLHFF